MKAGDRVVLKKRPKGHDVPGKVVHVGERFADVEIRPGKVVKMLIAALEIVK